MTASPRKGTQVIIERAGRNDGGTYNCWDTTGEAATASKQVKSIYPIFYIIYHHQIKIKVCTILSATNLQVQILYPPKLTVSKVWVVGGEGGGLVLHLVCR